MAQETLLSFMSFLFSNSLTIMLAVYVIIKFYGFLDSENINRIY